MDRGLPQAQEEAFVYEAVLLIVYGIMVCFGGVMGFIKAKSKPSLIAGTVAGVLSMISGAMVWSGAEVGALMGLGVSAALCLIFALRLARTKSMMPSGMMLVISILVTVLLAAMIW